MSDPEDPGSASAALLVLITPPSITSWSHLKPTKRDFPYLKKNQNPYFDLLKYSSIV
jgi:hypothetical protein